MSTTRLGFCVCGCCGCVWLLLVVVCVLVVCYLVDEMADVVERVKNVLGGITRKSEDESRYGYRIRLRTFEVVRWPLVTYPLIQVSPRLLASRGFVALSSPTGVAECISCKGRVDARLPDISIPPQIKEETDDLSGGTKIKVEDVQEADEGNRDLSRREEGNRDLSREEGESMDPYAEDLVAGVTRRAEGEAHDRDCVWRARPTPAPVMAPKVGKEHVKSRLCALVDAQLRLPQVEGGLDELAELGWAPLGWNLPPPPASSATGGSSVPEDVLECHACGRIVPLWCFARGDASGVEGEEPQFDPRLEHRPFCPFRAL